MKPEYDFSKGKRGAVDPTPPGKTRITIRLDNEVIEWFKTQIELAGGGNYQTDINQALIDHITRKSYPLEEMLRQVVREELALYNTPADVKPAKPKLPKGSPINDELPDDNPFKGIVGIFSGGSPDTARRAKEILTAEVNSKSGFGY